MTDQIDSEKRSWNMSRIRSINTKPEEIVRKYLFSHGYRYRKNDKRYPGKPDIVLPKYHTVIFVNGCFWHCHPGCKRSNIPKSNEDYWIPKLKHNTENDNKHYTDLKAQGWKIIVIWECELKKRDIENTMKRIVAQIKENGECQK